MILFLGFLLDIVLQSFKKRVVEQLLFKGFWKVQWTKNNRIQHRKMMNKNNSISTAHNFCVPEKMEVVNWSIISMRWNWTVPRKFFSVLVQIDRDKIGQSSKVVSYATPPAMTKGHNTKPCAWNDPFCFQYAIHDQKYTIAVVHLVWRRLTLH